MWETIRKTSSHATRQGALIHSRISSVSHCGLISGLNSGAGEPELISTKTPKQNNNRSRGMMRGNSHHHVHSDDATCPKTAQTQFLHQTLSHGRICIRLRSRNPCDFRIPKNGTTRFLACVAVSHSRRVPADDVSETCVTRLTAKNWAVLKSEVWRLGCCMNVSYLIGVFSPVNHYGLYQG